MSSRPVELRTLDLDLLRQIDRDGNLVHACRRLGIGRDRGTYLLRRLTRALGRPVVESHRGGRRAGSTTLTREGQRLLRDGVPGGRLTGSATRTPPTSTPIRGVWHGTPSPHVDVDAGPRLYVTFRAREGERVSLGIPPDSVLLARARFPSSARNVISGKVRRVQSPPATRTGGARGVEVDVGGMRVWAAVTHTSVRRLGLHRGRKVVVYLKATAVHRW